MAMYYYASKLNEASCSGCSVKVPPVSETTASSTEIVPLTADPTLLHGSGLSYYDNDDYYSMVRGNKLMSESSCKHMIMNGGLAFMSAQKVEPGQVVHVSIILKPEVECAFSPPLFKNQGNGGLGVGVGMGVGVGVGVVEETEYREGQLVSASVEALVEMLRPSAPPSFTFTFLLCSRLFLKPHELLANLCKRYFKNYDKPGKLDETMECPEKDLADMGSLVRVLTQWTGMFPYDFRDDRVMALVRTITQRCASDEMSGVRAEVSRTLERLLDRLTALEQYEQALPEPAPLCTVEQLPQGDILTLGLSPVELARQLTAVELYRLSFVGPEEFLQAFATPSAKSPAAPKTTRNLEAYADWFNRLSYLVATDIVKPVKSKHRARLLEQWVTTARECFNLGNFNSLMAIISALNMAPIARLKKTWSRASAVCGQQLRQLELCVEPGGNHARYRAALAAAPGDTAVPLLSVTCRDLHFAHQSAPTRVAGGRVNFEKCCALARPVRAQLAARRLGETVGTPHRPAHAVNAHVTNTPTWCFFVDRPALTETALELVSFEREPPADHLEKERLKRLKGAAP